MNQSPPSTRPNATRRKFLAASGAALAAALLPRSGWPRTQQETPASPPPSPELIEELVAANRVLAAEGLVDGYGHVSARHDRNPGRFLLSRSMAPELVTAADIMEFDLESRPVDARGRATYLEVFIHGEIYKARPDVRAVVHTHSPALIPFGVTGTPLRPVYHMAAFIGQGVPLFEIRAAGGLTDMLIRTPELGRALARTLGPHPAALMRGHGGVVVGDSIRLAVGRSYYLQMNARLQSEALALGRPITYLDPEEARRREEDFGRDGYSRAWELWKRKALR